MSRVREAMTAVSVHVSQWDVAKCNRWDEEFEAIAYTEQAYALNKSLAFRCYKDAVDLQFQIRAGLSHLTGLEYIEYPLRCSLDTLLHSLQSASNRGSERNRSLTAAWCSSDRLAWVYWMPVDAGMNEWRRVGSLDPLHFDALRGPACDAFYEALGHVLREYSLERLGAVTCEVRRRRSGEGRGIQARINCL
jgi:hypothetical protein